MKKAAFLLLMSTTAFAANTSPVSTTSPKAPQSRAVSPVAANSSSPDDSADSSTDKSQDDSQKPSSTIKQRTKAHPTVSAASAQYPTALAKRNPRASVSANMPSDPGIKAPKFGDWELKFQLRNDTTFANVEELQNIGGKSFENADEVRLGLKHKSGWGFMLTGTYTTENYADDAKNTGVAKDASLIVSHPSIYKDNTFDLAGSFRAYLPTSESSRASGTKSLAYYSTLDITLAKRFSLSNLIIARAFTSQAQTADSPVGFVYDALELSHASAKGLSLALGVQGENDFAVGGKQASEIDIYPFVDITIIPNLLIEPKYYFPLFSNGGATQGASGAALNQTLAELFIKMAI